jgi:ABC-type phosphate/phosphonate transport system permease subunit
MSVQHFAAVFFSAPSRRFACSGPFFSPHAAARDENISSANVAAVRALAAKAMAAALAVAAAAALMCVSFAVRFAHFCADAAVPDSKLSLQSGAEELAACRGSALRGVMCDV